MSAYCNVLYYCLHSSDFSAFTFVARSFKIPFLLKRSYAFVVPRYVQNESTLKISKINNIFAKYEVVNVGLRAIRLNAQLIQKNSNSICIDGKLFKHIKVQLFFNLQKNTS